MHVAAVDEVVLYLAGGAGTHGEDTLCIAGDFAVDEFDCAHLGREVLHGSTCAVTVENDILDMQFGGTGCKGEHQALDSGLLAFLSGVAVDGDVAHDGSELLGLVRIDRGDVVGIGTVVEHQFDGAGLVVESGKQGCGRTDDSLGAVGVGTGVRSNAATLSGLAEEKGEAVLAAGLQTGDGLGCRTDFLNPDGNLGFGSISFLEHHGLNQHGGKVGSIVGFVPGDGDGVLGAGLDHGVQRSTHGGSGESSLQIRPVGCLQIGVDTTHTGIEGFVHFEAIHSVGNLVGLHVEHVHEGSGVGSADLLGVVGLLIDLEFVALGVLDLLPGKDHVRTGGRNHLSLELRRGEHAGVVDLVEHFGALLAGSEHERASEDTKYVFKYLFHTRNY